MLPPGSVRETLRVSTRWALSPRIAPARQRVRTDALMSRPGAPRGTRISAVSPGGVPADELAPPRGAPGGPVLLYLHGGGYVVGSPRGYRGLAGKLAMALGARAIVPEYRLAPEHPAPAALEDARAAYEGLLANGVPPSRLVVAGDSAGGGLTLALAFALRDAGRPLPAALGLICPWTDLRPDLALGRPPAPREPLLDPHRARRWARDYLSGGAQPDDPSLSPVLGDLRGLPPIVMHSCADDLIVEDSWALARRADAAGAALEHRHLEGLWHVVHLSAWAIREIGDPVADLGRSLGRHLG